MKTRDKQTRKTKPLDRQSITAFVQWLQKRGIVFACLHVHTTRCYERNLLACGQQADSLMRLPLPLDHIMALFEESLRQPANQSIEALPLESPASFLQFIEDAVTRVISLRGPSTPDDR